MSSCGGDVGARLLVANDMHQAHVEISLGYVAAQGRFSCASHSSKEWLYKQPRLRKPEFG